MQHLTNFKQKRIRSEKHLKFIRSLPCCVTGNRTQVQAAHIRLGTDGGTSLKPSDCFVLPLSAAEHFTQHNRGERTYWGERLDSAIDLALSLFEHTGNEIECHKLILGFLKQKET